MSAPAKPGADSFREETAALEGKAVVQSDEILVKRAAAFGQKRTLTDKF